MWPRWRAGESLLGGVLCVQLRAPLRLGERVPYWIKGLQATSSKSLVSFLVDCRNRAQGLQHGG